MGTTATLVTGAGGFIGGHLVRDLVRHGFRVRAVDRKPLDDWYQITPDAENVIDDLSDLSACRRPVDGMDTVYSIGGVRLSRSYDLSAPQGVRGRNSDNTMLREATGWEPSTSLLDGLERTYRWIYDELVAARPPVHRGIHLDPVHA
jgi:nucleoside-diphosphate-sugar epimerase